MSRSVATALMPPSREVQDARRRNAGLIWAVFVFSMFTNLLMLTGPLFML